MVEYVLLNRINVGETFIRHVYLWLIPIDQASTRGVQGDVFYRETLPTPSVTRVTCLCSFGRKELLSPRTRERGRGGCEPRLGLGRGQQPSPADVPGGLGLSRAAGDILGVLGGTPARCCHSGAATRVSECVWQSLPALLSRGSLLEEFIDLLCHESDPGALPPREGKLGLGS